MQRGAAHVGINEVTDAAGVARMTLYNNFPSKEALTTAVYAEMAEVVLGELDERAAAVLPEAARVDAFFDYFGRRHDDVEFRGCPFIHASLQEAEPDGPLRSVAQVYKQALRARVLSALDATRADREGLADQIVILLDGAVTEAYIRGVAEPMSAARRAAATLLALPER